ncbi:MAG: DNA polymerase I [Oscillospiraceae bacterium]|jgi:DNA polymerase I-like protein with 3'-5' exonuclease and polymerase domains/5'-3' exonuclease|nr:DNA polymerase I [Oscillospiraceae bacterium]
MTLLLIDGNSVANRAYYGLTPLSNSSGAFTHSVTGFLNIFLKLAKDIKPDGIAAAFDIKTPQFRKDIYDGYKAGRKKMPDELAEQMPRIKSILSLLGVSVLSDEGFEADDIIGSVSAKCRDTGDKCVIYTGDRDYLQLVREDVTVIIAGNKGDKKYTPETLIAEYGLTPQQMLELKSVMGDTSDNIPGIVGIGEKTAIPLIRKYGTLENIYAHIDDLTIPDEIKGDKKIGKAALEKIRNGRQSAEMSRELGRIRLDAPTTDNIHDYLVTEDKRNEEALTTVLTELEMYAALAKIREWLRVGNKTPLETGSDNPENSGKEVFTPADKETELAAYILDGNTRYSGAAKDKLLADIKKYGAGELLYNVELPLSDILTEMERSGVRVDTAALTAFGEELKASIAELEKAAYMYCGEEFNLNSPKQLGEILFGKLGIPLPANTKKTKTGNYTTDAETLEKISDSHPALPVIINYRTVNKLYSTYVVGLLAAIGADGRIHTTYRQTETRTGRLSSVEPNLQNIPVRTELGKQFRKFFIADTERVLVGGDYSQIELRVLAHLSGDENLIKAFKDDEDIHTITAAQVFGVAPDFVTSELRRRAKAVNFGIIYGIGAFSLAKDIGVPVYEAKRYIEGYLSHYKGIDAYMKNVVDTAIKTGYSVTMFGRRRGIPELHGANRNIQALGKRIAQNAPIQGTAADIIKFAMVAVHKALSVVPSARLILQIHDELIVECDNADREVVSELLKREMENAVQLSVPLTVDVKSGLSWYECH